MGHVALHEALAHERTLFNDLIVKHWISGGKTESLINIDPELYEIAKGRWKKAIEFSEWAMDAYRKQVEGES